MQKTKILIATTNEGKLQEIKHFLQDLPFELVSLSDLSDKPQEPEETGETIEENAILKATYYAKATGLISLADDGGLFVDALDGWPGVRSARVASTSDEQCSAVLERMKDVGDDKRKASFKLALALYDPMKETIYVAHGETRGTITHNPVNESLTRARYGFNRIFLVDILEKAYKKTYAELTIEEKNAVSHRGKALIKMKYFLQNQYGVRHIVVPFALIIKDGKVLMTKRNDPHRPDYHNKWEFPGGSMEFGETFEQNVIRETKEEAGYEVEVIKMLSYIAVEGQEYPTWKYQVYLIPFVCRVTGGNGIDNNSESLGIDWFGLDDVLNHELVGENAKMYKIFLPELKEVIRSNNL